MSDVYSEEEEALDNRPSGGGGLKFDWFDSRLVKPTQQGKKTVHKLRVIQRLPMIEVNGQKVSDWQHPYPRFWVRADVHRFKHNGTFHSLVCPENHDDPNWAQNATCPICVLRKELFEMKDAKMEKLAKKIGTKVRCFANVIDLKDDEAVRSHWTEGSDGNWVARPKVWAFSRPLLKDMLSFCQNLKPIEDAQIGRALLLEIEKFGPEDINLKYRLMTLDPEPIPQELMPIVYNAYDLGPLVKPADHDKLLEVARGIDPRPNGGSYGASPEQSYQGAGGYQGGGYSGPPQGGPPQGGGYAPPPPAPPPQAPPQAPPPQNETRYHYTYNGQSRGEVPVSAIVDSIIYDSNGQHFVWAAGWPNWVNAAQVTEITDAVDAANAPPPQAPPPQTMTPPQAPPGPPVPPQQQGYHPRGGYPTPQAPQGPPAGPPQGYGASPPHATPQAPPQGPPQGYGGPPPQGPPQGPPQQAGPPGPPQGPPAQPGPPAGPPMPPGPPGPPGGSAF